MRIVVVLLLWRVLLWLPLYTQDTVTVTVCRFSSCSRAHRIVQRLTCEENRAAVTVARRVTESPPPDSDYNGLRREVAAPGVLGDEIEKLKVTMANGSAASNSALL